MSIIDELYVQHNQHPLDADLDMFYKAANRIKELEEALLNIVRANSSWFMNMEEEDSDEILRIVREIESGGIQHDTK